MYRVIITHSIVITSGTHIEAVRLQPADPDEIPVARPEFLDHRYVLPQHCVKFLETQNPHLRDGRIVVLPEPPHLLRGRLTRPRKRLGFN